jgi:hypothetical protein
LNATFEITHCIIIGFCWNNWIQGRCWRRDILMGYCASWILGISLIFSGVLKAKMFRYDSRVFAREEKVVEASRLMYRSKRQKEFLN